MPSRQKVPIKGSLVEVTFRTEEGLPMVPTMTMNKILGAHLGAAASRYRIRPIAWMYMGNHVHMLVIVDDPEDLPHFVEYVKRENAHAINNLLGRNQRTVWKDGYDPVVVLDGNKAIERLVYFYLNPVRAGLVESIDDYPGFSSWVNGFQETFTLTEKHIGRETIPALNPPSLTDHEDLRLSRQLGKNSKKVYSVEIDCLGWMECWDEWKQASRSETAQLIRDTVYQEERRLAAERLERKVSVIGARNLRRQSMLKQHTPKKVGKRMLCMGSDVEQRKMVISWFKALYAERDELKKKLAPREFLKHVFPGFFRAGGYMDANLNPLFVPF